MTRRKALERWETRIGNCEVTPQAIGPIAKSLIKRDEPKAPTAVRDLLGLKYHPLEKNNSITGCLEKQFTSNYLCDENREPRVEARVQDLLESVEHGPSEEEVHVT
jgi:hypothetical protein